VAPERLTRWLDGFQERHGPVAQEVTPDQVRLRAADGALAVVTVPFPPLHPSDEGPYAGLPDHATAPRTVGVLLVRLGGHAAGVFRADRLVEAKVGSRHVQGRTAAGGWSQQRFARRRAGQARVAFAAAADVAASVLVPVAGQLDAVILGGDRRAVADVLDDPRLEPLRALVVPPHLEVPDPRRRVLESVPGKYRMVRIRVVDPGGR
jgi:hypothetical protein